MDKDKRDRIVNLALYQGNRFIKDLLRDKKLPIGTTEKEFRVNLGKSLDNGKLSEKDIEEWLDKVEGWGDQQAYVFRASAKSNQLSHYRDFSRFTCLAASVKKENLINRSHIDLMPKKRMLSLIQHSHEKIRFVWHESLVWKKRLQERDYEEIDKKLETRVFYQAYMEQWGRGVASFEWRFDLGLAAVFIPRRSSEDYESQKEQIVSTVCEIIKPITTWPALKISKAIFALDDKANSENPKKRTIRSTKTNFEAAGGVVVIESTIKDGALQDSIPLQTVRRVITPDLGFSGRRGDFYIRPNIKGEDLHAVLYAPKIE